MSTNGLTGITAGSTYVSGIQPGLTSSTLTSGSLSPIANQAFGSIGASYAVQSHSLTDRPLIDYLMRDAKDGRHSKVLDGINAHFENCQQLVVDGNLSSAISNLARFACELPSKHYHREKAQAFDLLNNLLETDPITKDSSHGVVDLAMDLMKNLDRNLIQTQSVDFQKKTAYAYSCVVENLLRYYNAKHLNSLTSELKKQLLETDKALGKLNTLKDSELQQIVEVAREGIKRIKDDTTTFSKTMGIMGNVADGLGALWKKDISNFFIKMYDSLKEIDDIRTESWYETYFFMRDLMKKAFTDEKECSILLAFISKTSSSDIHLAFAGLDMLTCVARHTNSPEIRELVLVNKTAGLTSFLTSTAFTTAKKSKDNDERDHKVRYRAAELLIECSDKFKGEEDLMTRTVIRETLIGFPGSRIKDEAVNKLLSSIVTKDQEELAVWLGVSLKEKPSSTPSPQQVTSSISAPVKLLLKNATVVINNTDKDENEKTKVKDVTQSVLVGGTVTSTVSLSAPVATPLYSGVSVAQLLLKHCFPGNHVPPAELAKHLKDNKIKANAFMNRLVLIDKEGVNQFIDLIKTFGFNEVDLSIIDDLYSEKLVAISASLNDTRVEHLTLDIPLSKYTATALATGLINARNAGKPLIISFTTIGNYHIFGNALKALNHTEYASAYYNVGIDKFPRNPNRWKIIKEMVPYSSFLKERSLHFLRSNLFFNIFFDI